MAEKGVNRQDEESRGGWNPRVGQVCEPQRNRTVPDRRFRGGDEEEALVSATDTAVGTAAQRGVDRVSLVDAAD